MNSDPEEALRSTWSMGPLRPWLKMLAERQIPAALRARVDPSDIVQQTLMDAWRGREGFRGTTHAERLAWLRVILARTLAHVHRDQLKTTKRGEGREQLLQAAIDGNSMRLEQLATASVSSPSAAAQRAEQALLLSAALERLPEDYREVLLLRHIEQLEHTEVAHRMNRSSAAVRMLWVRALEAIKKEMTG